MLYLIEIAESSKIFIKIQSNKRSEFWQMTTWFVLYISCMFMEGDWFWTVLNRTNELFTTQHNFIQETPILPASTKSTQFKFETPDIEKNESIQI